MRIWASGYCDLTDLRRFMLAPVPEIAEAARLLDRAVDEHLAHNFDKAASLIRAADLPEITMWVEALWGKNVRFEVRRFKPSHTLPSLPEMSRFVPHMPKQDLEKEILARDGYHCRFCGIPLVRNAVRKRLRALYPEALRWKTQNATQHAAFQAMQLVFDHIIPWSRGGPTTADNLVVACQPCNCGRAEALLEEVSLLDPRDFPPIKSGWDGLERGLHA